MVDTIENSNYFYSCPFTFQNLLIPYMLGRKQITSKILQIVVEKIKLFTNKIIKLANLKDDKDG